MSREYEEMQVEKWVNLEDVAEHLSISQDTVIAADYREWKDHLTRFMGLVHAGQFICNRPDQGGFFTYIGTQAHASFPSLSFSCGRFIPLSIAR